MGEHLPRRLSDFGVLTEAEQRVSMPIGISPEVPDEKSPLLRFGDQPVQ